MAVGGIVSSIRAQRGRSLSESALVGGGNIDARAVLLTLHSDCKRASVLRERKDGAKAKHRESYLI